MTRRLTRSDSSARASGGMSLSVIRVSISSRSANELRPTIPHFVWSAITMTRRAERTNTRLVSDSARLGVVSPAGGADEHPVGLGLGQVGRGQPGDRVDPVAAEEEQVEAASSWTWCRT